MGDFNLDAFIKDLENNSSKPKSASDRLNRVLMNVRENQGTLVMLPFISSSIGNCFIKLEKVREFKGYTTLIDYEDPIWYKILPIGAYGNLTPEQIELYNEVSGLYDQLYETEELDYGEIRVRNYSLMLGVALKVMDIEGNERDVDFLNVPGLFLYPSTNVIDAFSSAVAAKKKLLGDKIMSFLQDIITPSLTNRKGVLQIEYKKAAIGYDVKIDLERNSEFKTLVDPDMSFTEEFAKNFDNPMECFLGWMYDRENNTLFNEGAFRELKKNLQMRLKEVTTGVTENEEKPEMPPVPGVEPKAERPF